jgi:hypothetical protein
LRKGVKTMLTPEFLSFETPVHSGILHTSSQGIDVDYIKRIIDNINEKQMVRKNGNNFLVNIDAVTVEHPDMSSLVVYSTARANIDPTLSRATEENGNIIGRLAGFVGDLANIPELIERISAGSTSKVEWWGVEVDLNVDATNAMITLLGADLTALTGALALIPGLAPITLIIAAIGLALAGWITLAKSDKGVRMGLYLWIVPAVTPL